MLRITRSLALAGIACTLPGAALSAQGKWVGHEAPCELSTGHYLIRGGVVYLQQAVETRFDDQRDSRLAEALRVLSEAVTTGGQADNPAAWYYFGRYYVEMNDAPGADSTFRRAEAMVPSCAEDIAQYRRKVGPLALNEALRTWGEQRLDSAAYYFHLAHRLTPQNAEIPLYVGTMYATSNQLDSAQKYVARGLEEAGADTTYIKRRQEAMRELARAFETRAYQDQTVIRGPQARITRDTIQPTITEDSTILDRMVGRVQEIRGQGRQLDPQSLQAFQQESTTVAQRLARARQVRDQAIRQAAADSQAAARVLDPAIGAYERYVEAYPEDGDATMRLARLHSAAGRAGALRRLIDRVVTGEIVDAPDMVQGALTLSGEGQLDAARRLLDAALERNPNDYNALFVLARMLYTARDGALHDVAVQLRALDPLSQNTMRTMAMAWDLAGRRDSVTHYVAMADSGIGWNVNITQFTPRDSSTVVSGAVTNVSARSLPATTLVFDFLDAQGNVVFSHPVEVPPLEPRGRERLSIRLDQGGAAAWRYRQQGR